MGAIRVQTPVAGLYRSVEARTVVSLYPPVTRTVASGNFVAVWPDRASFIAPVIFHLDEQEAEDSTMRQIDASALDFLNKPQKDGPMA